VQLKDEIVYFSSNIIVVACGAINSAALLLRSANDRHPNGLANSSDLVGRNFMKHQHGAIIGLTPKPNPTEFQKTIGILDYYWGEPDFNYPMGAIQLLGKVNKDIIAADAPGFSPGMALDVMAQHSVDWFITAEDLPDPNNRVTYKNGSVHLNYTENNTIAFDRLMKRWIGVLKSILVPRGFANDCGDLILPVSLYFRKKLSIAAVAHQNGTCRFGADPTDSVLDIDCRTHDVDNLYIVDGSFFPSSAAVNPTLTIIANTLRVGDRSIEIAILSEVVGLTSQAEFICSDFLSISQETIKANSGSSLMIEIELRNQKVITYETLCNCQSIDYLFIFSCNYIC
jgi:choline dehydrogenase-like flavoprotein